MFIISDPIFCIFKIFWRFILVIHLIWLSLLCSRLFNLYIITCQITFFLRTGFTDGSVVMDFVDICRTAEVNLSSFFVCIFMLYSLLRFIFLKFVIMSIFWFLFFLNQWTKLLRRLFILCQHKQIELLKAHQNQFQILSQTTKTDK